MELWDDLCDWADDVREGCVDAKDAAVDAVDDVWLAVKGFFE